MEVSESVEPIIDDALAAFVDLVLRDDTLQSRLGEIENADVYVDAAVSIASLHGVALNDEAVCSSLQPHPPGMARFFPSPVTLNGWPPSGWLPARSVPTDDAPAFDWIWFGTHRLGEPFFEDTVRRFESRPFNRMFRTRTTSVALMNGSRGFAVAEPSGFIHHMSRCGSTLIAQMLGADPDHVVLSEAEPLDAAVRWAMQSSVPEAEKISLLRAIVAALGQGRSRTAHRVFIKLDSWHAAALPLFRAAFPTTPWIFVYRDPVEVLVSQMRRRGIHTVPGMLPAGFIDMPDAEGMAPERYAASSLAGVVRAALDNRVLGGGLLVDYAELPAAVITSIAPHFGFQPELDQRVAMLGAAKRDAKEPDQLFTADGLEKRQAATPEIVDAACAYFAPLSASLSAWRTEDERNAAGA